MLRRICVQASSQATITTRRTTCLFIRKSKSDDCRYLRPRPLASIIFLSAAVLPTPPTPAPIASPFSFAAWFLNIGAFRSMSGTTKNRI
eukprot:m.32080 g.32080  ORF g.32080 m.32080 type:complete len:89 (+) comp7005_c0_seq1:104-370(+)